MEKITRRLFLGSAAVVGAMGSSATAGARRSTPDERIEAAIEEIKAAMAEKNPDWRVQVKNDFQHSISYPSMESGDPYCHAVLIYSSSEKYGPEDARWFRVYR